MKIIIKSVETISDYCQHKRNFWSKIHKNDSREHGHEQRDWKASRMQEKQTVRWMLRKAIQIKRRIG